MFWQRSGPRPVGVGRAWSLAFVLIIFAIGTGFILTHKPQKDPNATSDELRHPPGAGSWTDEDVPAHIAATPAPSPAPSPGIITRVGNQLSEWHSGSTEKCNQDCQAARRFKAEVQGADGIIPIPGADTLELTSANTPKVFSTAPACVHRCLRAFTWIYATLETGISSDRLGDVIGRVSQSMRAADNEVLIPFGSKLHGHTKRSLNYNLNVQTVDVDWDTLELPNGAEYPLPHLAAADVDGYPGLTGDIDRHLAQKWGPALLVSTITAFGMLAQNPTYGSSGGYNSTQMATGAFGSSMSQQAMNGLSQLLQQTQPTITIPKGKELRVLVTQDIPFDHAWENP